MYVLALGGTGVLRFNSRFKYASREYMCAYVYK